MKYTGFDIMERAFFGNTLENYLWFAGILVLGFIFKKLISKLFAFSLYSLIKKVSGSATANEFHELLKKPFSFLLFLILGYFAVIQLEYPWGNALPGSRLQLAEHIIAMIFDLALIAAITWIFLRVVDFFALILYYRATKTETRIDDQLVPFFRDGLKIVVVILSIFFTLASVFDVNVVTLIGGLGIGGLAVALAAKETLENLLGSFTIFLDKPFAVGDHVKLGSIDGHVESIGLRSTRIRTLEKCLVSVPNKKMVDVELVNISERSYWRIKFVIGVLYSTKTESLHTIVEQIKVMLDKHPMVEENPLVRFKHFGSSSLDIGISCLIKTNDHDLMIAVREEMNFEIMRIVRENGTDFAFPSTSIYIEKD